MTARTSLCSIPLNFNKMDTPDQPTDDDGLLVPKQGGSENRRVRKKRVRPVKETMYAIELRRRTMRIRLMIALAVLVLAAALAALVAWYPGTPHFRKRFDQMALDSTGTKIEVQNAQFSAFEAKADRVDASWPDGNFLGSFSAEQVSASVLPQRHFSRTYGGDEIWAERGRLVVRYPDPEAPATLPAEAGGKSGVNFTRIGIPDFEVQFGDAQTPASAAIIGTEAAFYPEGPAGMPRALLYSGNLDIPFWPSLLLERAIVDFPPGSTRITSMRIRDSLPGNNNEALVGGCDVTGEITLDPDGISTLQIELDGFRLQALIGDDAGRIFVPRGNLSAPDTGELRANAGRIFVGRVDTRPGQDAGVVRFSRENGIQMRAALVASPMSELTFKHFPFIDFIARAVDDRWFQNPTFEDAPSMVVIRDGGQMVFDEIQFTSRHRMAIRGSFAIDMNDEISGEIEVGLSPTVIDAAVARRLDGMFSSERDDFRWVKLELGGNIHVPTDNFNAQFIDAPLPEIERPPALPPAPPEEQPEQTEEPQQAERPPSVLPLLDLDDE